MILKKATYVISNQEVEKCPKGDKPEYAFIGRSNVGKSSLINLLVNQQGLAKTSGTPGKTQLINHFIIESKEKEKAASQLWYLVDLPGYGYAKVAQKERAKWEKMIDDYLRKRENLCNTFVLIDSRHEPQEIDLAFIHHLGLMNIPFSLVFTKADKSKPGAVKRHVENFLNKMRETWQFLPQSFITSAEKKEGQLPILTLIQQTNNSFYEHQIALRKSSNV